MSGPSAIDAALDCCRRGRLDAARAVLEPIAAEHPSSFDVVLLLARVNIAQQRWAAAADCARAALRFRPDDSGAWRALARCNQGMGQTTSALACYRRALTKDRNNPRTLTQIATLLLELGRRDQAVQLLQRVLAAAEYPQARARLDQLLGPVPGGVDAVEQLRKDSQRLREAGRLEEALELHRRALRIKPELPGIWLSAGLIANQIGDRDASLSFLETAARLDPELFPALDGARRICISAGLFEKADLYSRKCQALRPSDDIRIARALTIPAILESVEAIQAIRAAYEQGLDSALAADLKVTDVAAAQGMNGFFLAYHGENDCLLQSKAAALLGNAAPWLRMTAPHCRAPRRPGKIRVGFLSAFFSDHSIGNTSRGLIAHLSRTTFEVFGLRITPSKDDHITSIIRSSADQWIDLDPTLLAARERIASLELDVLFFQDIGMEPMSYALAFARLAPVQCVSFGHPNTTGIPTVDYFVSNDLYEPPGSASHYTERLFLLKDLPTLAYYQRPPPADATSRESFGLRDEDHVYICPQMPFKLHPEFDAMLREILMRDPEGIVVLIRVAFYGYTESLQRRFERTLAPVLDRVIFLDSMPYPRFLQFLAVADVCLDTPHFNGMNTSLEALSVGTPIVTLPGRMQRGRHTQAMYQKMDMTDCVAGTPAEYVDIALRLAADEIFADSVRSRIRERARVLFEDQGVVREFERFFLEAHEEAQATLS